jgi:Tat protein translocase TatB subunit
MFGIGTPEIVGIVFITLMIYGPDRLPGMIKKVVGFLRQIKGVTDEVSNSVSKEIHRIERSEEIQAARNLVEYNRNLIEQGKLDIEKSIQQPVTPEKKDDHEQ